MNRVLWVLGYLWASPNTFLGLYLGLINLLTGGRVHVVRGVVEFHGGFMKWLLHRHLLAGNVAALTMGHVIFGQTLKDLEVSRDHEHVHVRQYMRWGPFFLPAYLGCSLWLWYRGKNPYLDNPFEREAYGIRY